MNKNKEPGNGRIGAIKDRIQYLNPQTQQWITADCGSRNFLNVKEGGTPFKGVTKT